MFRSYVKFPGGTQWTPLKNLACWVSRPRQALAELLRLPSPLTRLLREDEPCGAANASWVEEMAQGRCLAGDGGLGIPPEKRHRKTINGIMEY